MGPQLQSHPTPGLQGEWFIHYTMTVLKYFVAYIANYMDPDQTAP